MRYVLYTYPRRWADAEVIGEYWSWTVLLAVIRGCRQLDPSMPLHVGVRP